MATVVKNMERTAITGDLKRSIDYANGAKLCLYATSYAFHVCLKKADTFMVLKTHYTMGSAESAFVRFDLLISEAILAKNKSKKDLTTEPDSDKVESQKENDHVRKELLC